VRTTIRLDDALYRAVKARAAAQGRTVAAVIEDALRLALAAPSGPPPAPRELPVFGGSGTVAGVDLSSNAAVLDAMERDAAADALR
jgi:plasmid stability protein